MYERAIGNHDNTVRSTPGPQKSLVTFAASSPALSTYSGRCTCEHVGVKAPGTPTRTAFLSPNRSRTENDLTTPLSSSRLARTNQKQSIAILHNCSTTVQSQPQNKSVTPYVRLCAAWARGDRERTAAPVRGTVGGRLRLPLVGAVLQ